MLLAQPSLREQPGLLLLSVQCHPGDASLRSCIQQQLRCLETSGLTRLGCTVVRTHTQPRGSCQRAKAAQLCLSSLQTWLNHVAPTFRPSSTKLRQPWLCSSMSMHGSRHHGRCFHNAPQPCRHTGMLALQLLVRHCASNHKEGAGYSVQDADCALQ